jgi:phytoene/squalene synthetase
MKALFDTTGRLCSKIVTEHYSTSFTLGIKTLDKSLHDAIFSIYGFVRYADEIVDTFYGFNQAELLDEFRVDTFKAIHEGISLNPILNSYQWVVNKYGIPNELTESFFDSMATDLYANEHDRFSYDDYIYGSAEVVGLMCLRVFVDGDQALYDKLEGHAKSLGAAFQKVNFLRDIKSDHAERGRTYFPGVDFDQFSEVDKSKIEQEILSDFDHAYDGIVQLPRTSRLGVFLAYRYYRALFKRIQRSSANAVKEQRIRVPDARKVGILLMTYVSMKFSN